MTTPMMQKHCTWRPGGLRAATRRQRGGARKVRREPHPGNKRRARSVTRIWRRSSPDVEKTRRRDACRPEPSALFGVGALLRTQSVSKRRRQILGALAAVAVILIGVLILFDWNWLTGPIESPVSGRLGRPFRIHGDLDVELSLQPRITIEGIELGNALWGSDAPMAKVDRVEAADRSAQVDPRRYRAARSQDHTDLISCSRRAPRGPPNWQFGGAEETTPGPPALPRSTGWRSAKPRFATTMSAADGTSAPTSRASPAARTPA